MKSKLKILKNKYTKILDEVGIHDFIIGFRLHFIEIMQPKFIPDWYNIYDLSKYNYDTK